ncbi:MAG: hypothetical protein EA408_11390 [Marinilabiliales bacterium]|nr:MAG: hypothetical protein EA408_11390 [Marinilabiliales bacterium]
MTTTSTGKLSRSGEPLGDFFVKNNNVSEAFHFDQGIYSRGISFYEVIKVQDKVPLFAEDHIERLIRSASGRNVTSIPPANLIMDNIKLLIDVNSEYGDGNIRVVLHCDVDCISPPHIYSYFIPHYYPAATEYQKGVHLITVNAERLDVHCKIIDMNFRVSIAARIRQENAMEALLVTEEGFVTEGSKSNFFAIKDELVVTPPEKDVLPGITRKYILEICNREGIAYEERKIHSGDLNGFSSCFITGTSPGVLPVRSIDNRVYSPVHPLLRMLSSKYARVVKDYSEYYRQGNTLSADS